MNDTEKEPVAVTKNFGTESTSRTAPTTSSTTPSTTTKHVSTVMESSSSMNHLLLETVSPINHIYDSSGESKNNFSDLNMNETTNSIRKLEKNRITTATTTTTTTTKKKNQDDNDENDNNVSERRHQSQDNNFQQEHQQQHERSRSLFFHHEEDEEDTDSTLLYQNQRSKRKVKGIHHGRAMSLTSTNHLSNTTSNSIVPTTTTTSTNSNSNYEVTATNNNSSSSSDNNNNQRNVIMKSVQKVGRQAARTTKHVVWDTNDLSITAALSAVGQFESVYHTLRQFVLIILQKFHHSYMNMKRITSPNLQQHHHDDTNSQQQHHFFVQFIRNYVIRPIVWGVESFTMNSISFIQSEQAKKFAFSLFGLIESIPCLGGTIFAPTLRTSGRIIKTMGHVIQYPIPSEQQVRVSVDTIMTSTKYLLKSWYNEIAYYIQRADANITRTLSHTQWKVYGSGPYVTLTPEDKQVIINHICERYLSLTSVSSNHDDATTNNGNSTKNDTNEDDDSRMMIARYELMSHIKRQNIALYIDLIVSKVLQTRGGNRTMEDEFLNIRPSYRTLTDDEPFLIRTNNHEKTQRQDYKNNKNNIEQVAALWFRLPNVNGEKPTSLDAPWVCYSEYDQYILEDQYCKMIDRYNNNCDTDCVSIVNDDTNNTMNDKQEQKATVMNNDMSTTPEKRYEDQIPSHPTIAQWYNFPIHNNESLSSNDEHVLVDNKRHTVSFTIHNNINDQYNVENNNINTNTSPQRTFSSSTLVLTTSDTYDDDNNNDNNEADEENVLDFEELWYAPPNISMIQRPNFWRFYGPGDEVCRAIWFLDIPGKGLQPFGWKAHAVLEDAYLFLQWLQQRESKSSDTRDKHNNDPTLEDAGSKSNKSENSNSMEGTLLTVEVTCPDGVDRLVQFSSLTRATAIQKGLSAAIALFKFRVYRGAWLGVSNRTIEAAAVKRNEDYKRCREVDERILNAVEVHGTLGDTFCPNVSLRSLLIPPDEDQHEGENDNHMTSITNAESNHYSLAAPVDRLQQNDMAKYLHDGWKTVHCNEDDDGDDVEHLVLIVHGIGEMLRSTDVFGFAMPSLSSIVDCCGFMRKNHAELQFVDNVTTSSSFISKGRVEYLPVEWHEAFAILSQRREGTHYQQQQEQPSYFSSTKPNVMMNDISLKTIPNMRNFANDTLLDVLYFMSREHHDMIIDVVVNEMNLVVNKFKQITNFNGKISIIGHSLGSIITWDILGNQQDEQWFDDLSSQDSISPMIPLACTKNHITVSNHDQIQITKPANFSTSNHLSYEENTIPLLDFPVSNFFLLGSPVAVFLMIRNQREPLKEDFVLPGCRRVYNVFHPYDPVAYRIEPCIDPKNAAYEPSIITHWNGGYRMHYETRRIWNKLILTTTNAQKDWVGAFEKNMTKIGLLGGTPSDGGGGGGGNRSNEVSDDDASDSSYYRDKQQQPIGIRTGQLNGGKRIDYMLQESEIENANEYVAALAAHSSYWPEKDLALFIATQISM